MNGKEMCVWIFGLSLLAMVLISPVACTMRRHAVISEAIRNGADPTEAKCAIEQDTESTPACVLAAARKP